MRLIDADALFKNNCIVVHGKDGEIVAQQMIEIIKNAPTVDAVKVVRCKNCTEWDNDEKECSHWYGFRENDYCCHGVRKDGANNE